MSTDRPQRTKYVLECLVLGATLIATAIGAYSTLKPESPVSDPSGVADRTSDTREAEDANIVSDAPSTLVANARNADEGLGNATVIMPPKSRVASDSSNSHVEPTRQTRLASSVLNRRVESAQPSDTRNSVSESLRNMSPQVQRDAYRDHLKNLLAMLSSFPSSVMTVRANVSQYDLSEEGFALDLDVGLDVDAYDDFTRRLKPLLDADVAFAEVIFASASNRKTPSTAPLRLVYQEERGVPYLDYSQSASSDALAILDEVVDKKRSRKDVVFPEVVAVVEPCPTRDHSPGNSYAANLWRLTPGAGESLMQMFERAEELKFQVSILDHSENVLATQTRSLAIPYQGTWDANRFVQPTSPFGYAHGLGRSRFAPTLAAQAAHRKGELTFGVVGLVPGYFSAAVRTDHQNGREEVGFRSSVRYQIMVPLNESHASQVRAAHASFVR
ncbi:MAG: hypothetical protein AAF989_02050 [Planctomycetota bacterium]